MSEDKKVPSWTSKIKRFSVKGRMYWYRTDDGGFTWFRISHDEAMAIIDSLPGVIIDGCNHA